MPHYCAVCFERVTDHAAWLKHVGTRHEATELPKFGLETCKRDCHALRLPRWYGTPPTPCSRPAPQPVTARDGTVYTPVPLPLEPPAA